MKQGTVDLLKFRKLVRRLNESARGVVGLLELMWAATAKQAPQGDIGRFSNEDIAELVDWDGDPDHLIQSLVSCGWLDESPEHRLLVHDWHEHASGWVIAALKKRKLPFLTGTRIAQSSEPSREPSSEPSREASLEPSSERSSERSTRARPFPSLAKPSLAKEEIPTVCVSEDSAREDPEAPEAAKATPPPKSTHTRRSRDSQEFFSPEFMPASHRTEEFLGAWRGWLNYVLDRDGRLVPSAVETWAMDATRRTAAVASERLRESVSRLAPSGPYWTELTGSRAGPPAKKNGAEVMADLEAKAAAYKQKILARSKEVTNAN